MTPETERLPIINPERIRRVLADRLRQRLGGFVSTMGQPVLLRAEVLVDGLSALPWLAAQPLGPRGYWSDRDQPFELAGIGRADMIAAPSLSNLEDGLSQLYLRLESAAGAPRYFGGLRFRDRTVLAREWEPFMGFRFVLPRFEVVQRDDVTVLACNMRSDDAIEDVDREIAKLDFLMRSEPREIPFWQRRVDLPDRSEWNELAGEVITRIGDGEMDKVVLARRVSLAFPEPPDAIAILQQLKANSHSSFHFCFQPDRDSAFIGASPERLYRRDGNRLRTEAIAGTRLRGQTKIEDEMLACSLFSEAKERGEQQNVVDDIEQSLADLVLDMARDPEPDILVLQRVQHLITRFRAVMPPFVGDSDLLRAMHPTAAVAGTPPEKAMGIIRRLEPFDRGFYAAPMGWIERDAAQFAVAIRSGLLSCSDLHLFSGAGIVDGSKSDDEWEEVEYKIQDFLSFLQSA